jgi:hypothetical protein
LDDFRVELSRYLEANGEALREAPFGLYAVAPPPGDVPQIQPGIIFCLRQNGAAAKTETSSPEGTSGASGRTRTSKLNPLHPFFLVYALESGDVRYTFAQPKQTLEIFRLLCADREEPYRQLCELFDRQTKNGTDMKTCNALLEKAIASIKSTFQKRIATGLQSQRDFVIPNQQDQATEKSDFELVTWLIIKSA